MPVHDYTPASTITTPPRFGYPQTTENSLLHLRDGVLVSTTTIIPSGTPTTTIFTGDGSPPVPIAAIVGGTVAGVLLAVTVVTAWMLWGRSIKREQRKQKRELLRALEVRENTRRNASSSGRGTPLGFSPASTMSKQKRAIKFGDERKPTGILKSSSTSDVTTASHARSASMNGTAYSRVPANPSPLSRSTSSAPPSIRSSPVSTPSKSPIALPPVPPIPRIPSIPMAPPVNTKIRLHLPEDTQPTPTLHHQPSSLSSDSVYSTPNSSFVEVEPTPPPQPRIPSGLIAAALGPPNEGKKFSFLNYLPPSRWTSNSEGPSRLSQFSSDSETSRPTSGVGYAS
ncbi:hypothetical protein QCA50_002616 [Cerrena zonata]|uniref:Uncharacterized protein n=1 Tax=Cerrena zonata TaxID=2478898 RepID=A0AAW0GI84_9APHY